MINHSGHLWPAGDVSFFGVITEATLRYRIAGLFLLIAATPDENKDSVAGWILAITVFLIVVGFSAAGIYFIVKRAVPSKADDRYLSFALGKISELNAQLAKERNKSSKKIKKIEGQLEKWRLNIQEYRKLHEELFEKGLVSSPPQVPPIEVIPLLEPLSKLIVATGSDPILDLDLTAFRTVRAQTGMQFTHIQNVTLGKLKNALNRERAEDRKVNLHLSVHSNPQGVEMAGGVVDVVALSEILEGVNVLVLAGCESDEIADRLGVVPFIISFNNKISNDDATDFSLFFWTAIGKRKTPEQALAFALGKCSPNISEFINSH